MDLRTPSEETLSIPILECRVNFPLQNVIPKIMQITFNGRSRCVGTPESVTSSGVTYLWANIVHSSSEYSYDFQSDFLSSSDENVSNCIPILKPPQPKPIQTQSNAKICGIPSLRDTSVVNQNSVSPGAFPWLTAVFESVGRKVGYRCSGSLVSNKHVITAANCLHKGHQHGTLVSSNKLLLVLGKHNIENLLIHGDEKVVGARDIKIHPDYVPPSPNADIAVVILAQEIAYTDFIKPICVWFDSSVYINMNSIVSQTGKVVGWDRDENNVLNPEPRQTTFRVVSQELCLRSAEGEDITSQRSFCAVEEKNFGACRKNKGGSGFMLKQNDRWILRGIASTNHYSNKSCDLSTYVVYTDVSKFRRWFQSIVTF